MVDFLIFISQKPVVVTLAIIGALLVTVANFFSKPKQTEATRINEGEAKADNIIKPPASLLSKRLIFAGYTIMIVSIILFIVAGFVSDLR